MKENNKGPWGLRMTRAVLAGVMTVGMMPAFVPAIAMADDSTSGGTGSSTATSMSADGLVTGAASRAAQPTTEILGISGVEETGNDWAGLGELSWATPKYEIFGTSEYNTNPNPYFVNAVTNAAAGTTVATPSAVLNPSRNNGNARGPMGALAAYGTGDETDDAVWDMMPDVIIGTSGGNGNVDYNSDGYAPAAGAANNNSSYKAYGVPFDPTTNSTMINTLYTAAKDADQVVSTENKQLRYGSAMTIAQNYEKYVKGTQGYILEQLANTGAQKKTFVVVQSYDPTSGTYTINNGTGADGTASQNRYVEAAELVGTNLATTLGKTTLTSDELAKADTIIIGGQGGRAATGAVTDADKIVDTMSPDMVKKTYWVTSANNGGAGATYGVVMNSPENAQNIGRILGFMYPEYVDQDDWMAYYYNNFYHIKDGKVADALDNAMDGVRNYDATGTTASEYLQWTAEDGSTYNKDAVQAKIDRGTLYLQSLGTNAPAQLQITDNIAKVNTDLASADVTLDRDMVYADGTAKEPAVTVTMNGVTLTQGVDYTVSYANNTDPGTATVTVTGKGIYSGTAVKSFAIVNSACNRLSGDTSLDTMLKIAEEGWGDSGSDVAIVATNDNGYWDALSASALAGAYNAPVLLTSKDALSDQTAKAISELGVKTVYIAGGPASVSDAVKQQIEAAGVTVERLSGDYATDTAIEVAAKANEQVKSDTCVIAASSSFYDALSAAPVAGAKHLPVYLANQGTGTLDQTTIDAIKAQGYTNAVIVGGPNTVKDATVDQLNQAGLTDVTRVSGQNAWETSEKVAEYGQSLGMSANSLGVADGNYYYDALTGAALCAKNNSVLVLVPHTGPSYDGDDFAYDPYCIDNFITANKASINNVYVFGGVNSVPDSTVEAIDNALK